MALDDNCRRRFLSNDDGNSEQESATDVMTRSSLDRELIKTAAKVAPTRPNKRTIVERKTPHFIFMNGSAFPVPKYNFQRKRLLILTMKRHSVI